MRQIKFRGKRIDNEDWVYGYYAVHHISLTEINRKSHQEMRVGTRIVHSIFNDEKKTESGYWKDVDPETIGQFTGLYDSDGKEIYDGDILSIQSIPDYAKEVVVFRNGCFNVRSCGFYESMASIETSERSIIGNIHDNPELIKGKQ